MKKHKSNEKNVFLVNRVPRSILAADIALAVVYFFFLAFWFPRGNAALFALLIFSEVFHMWQLGTLVFTLWNMRFRPPRNDRFRAPVDVFITVAGEPVGIVRNTVKAALKMDYPDFRVHVLNDGLVANKKNWRDIEIMVREMGANCITRTIPGGAKAGNINHGLKLTDRPFVAMLDADHVPHKDFLSKMMPYFADKRVAFVQSPQFYKNHAENLITQAAWDQQALFFGAICRGKNRLNSTTMCGTNMIIRRLALTEVNGMAEDSIAEDLLTGLRMHERGWKSYYASEVLAEGLAPEDFLSYYNQQYRWARGALDAIFNHRILGQKRLTWSQKIQYLSSISYFMSGMVVLINAVLPLVFFYTGQIPFSISTMLLAAVFLPYMFLTMVIIQQSSNYSFSWRSLAYSLSSFPIHIQALVSVFLGRRAAFSVTSKTKISGNFLYLAAPHIAYVALAFIGGAYSLFRHGLTPSLISNLGWAAVYSVIFSEFIRAALPSGQAVYAYGLQLKAKS